MVITFRNSFHNSSSTLRWPADGRTIWEPSPTSRRKVANDLCGMHDCLCHHDECENALWVDIRNLSSEALRRLGYGEEGIRRIYAGMMPQSWVLILPDDPEAESIRAEYL